MTRLYSQVFGVEAPAFMAWSIFPAPSGFWPHTMRGALFAGVWGGSPAFMAWSIFPASPRYWPHNMRGALFAGVWGGSPGLYGRGKQCFLFRFCALALVGAGQDFRGALRTRKGNLPGTASGRRARDYQKCNRDVSRNLPHRGCDGS